MKRICVSLGIAFVMAAVLWLTPTVDADGRQPARKRDGHIQLGPRPFFLVKDMTDGPLKAKLASCSEGPFEKTDFSIGHRGAALQFPEHTQRSLRGRRPHGRRDSRV